MWLDGDWRKWAYFISYEVGWVGLSLLLVTMCSSRHIRRNPVLISMTFSWWIGACPNSVFLFLTNTITGPQPTFSICLTSAALVMAQSPLVASSTVALVYNVWSVLRYSPKKSSGSCFPWTFLLVTFPYIVFLSSAAAVVIVGILDPSLVTRKTFYCVVDKEPLTTFLGAYSAVCCIISIILEGWIAVTLRSYRHEVLESGMDASLVLRVVVFGVYIFLGLVLSAISIRDWWSVVPDLCFSTFGLGIVFVFGSQRDVLRVWRRWFLPCTVSTEERTQGTSHRPHSSFDSAEIAKWRIPRKDAESEMSESWQELEDARYYERCMRREESGDTDGRTMGSWMTGEDGEEDANLALHYVHTRESSNEADPEGNPFSSVSTVSRFSSPPPAVTTSRERGQRSLSRPQPLGGAVARPTSVMDEYNPAFKLHSMQPPPPSPSILENPSSQPGTPTLVVSPPPPEPALSRSRRPFRPNLVPTSEQLEPPSQDVAKARLSQIGMAM